MPLKLKDISHPSSTNTLNKWADDQEQTLSEHSNLIQTLQYQIAQLQKAQK